MDYSALGQAVAASEDLTVAQATFERKLPDVGVALLRLVGYVEKGLHEPTNPTYKPARKCELTFEICSPRHNIEIGGKKVHPTIKMYINKTSSDKGKYIPLFKALNKASGNQFVHFAQMINRPFLAEIEHSECGKYANLVPTSFKAASQVDAISGVATDIPVPEMMAKPQVFLWEAKGISDEQYLEMWESIYVEGEYTNDKGEAISRNRLQEAVQDNIEWEGSVLQTLTTTQISLDEDLY